VSNIAAVDPDGWRFSPTALGYPRGLMASGRVVVITGASAGVGRATALEFARHGDRVALLARGTDALAGASRDISADGGEALSLSVDVADAGAVDAAATTIEEELGPIDVWVNDAMATVFAPFVEIDPEEFKRSTEVTYLGAVWGTRAALARMRPRDQGTIVQVGSALAYRGIPLQSAYCGAKHGVKGFTESVRTELIHDGSGVRITMVQLPALNTPQFEIGRTKLPRHPQPVPPIYQPEVAARAIVWASERAPREHYVGAPVWKTVWGNRLAPWIADRYLARNGYEAQQTDERVDPDRPDNLFAPVPGDHGAHGSFDDDARAHSVVSWAARHRVPVAAAAALATAALAAPVVRGRT
jgi:NAD(P)-dependent dehydrogenase (short-subunit alcohol dehydrogenase family)